MSKFEHRVLDVVFYLQRVAAREVERRPDHDRLIEWLRWRIKDAPDGGWSSSAQWHSPGGLGPRLEAREHYDAWVRRLAVRAITALEPPWLLALESLAGATFRAGDRVVFHGGRNHGLRGVVAKQQSNPPFAGAVYVDWEDEASAWAELGHLRRAAPARLRSEPILTNVDSAGIEMRMMAELAQEGSASRETEQHPVGTKAYLDMLVHEKTLECARLREQLEAVTLGQRDSVKRDEAPARPAPPAAGESGDMPPAAPPTRLEEVVAKIRQMDPGAQVALSIHDEIEVRLSRPEIAAQVAATLCALFEGREVSPREAHPVSGAKAAGRSEAQAVSPKRPTLMETLEELVPGLARRPEPQAVSPGRPAAGETEASSSHFVGETKPARAEGPAQGPGAAPAVAEYPLSERAKKEVADEAASRPAMIPQDEDEDEDEDELERVTGVAILTLDGVWSLPKPARHHHLIDAWFQATRKPFKGQQGFSTTQRTFVTREEGLQIATAAKQLVRTPTGTLTSEDLW